MNYPTRYYIDDKSIPGDQFDYPMVITTDRTVEEVWNKLIDVIAVEGYGINRLDKENGIYISDRVSFETVTHLDEKGNLENENAYFVIPKVYFQWLKGVNLDKVQKSILLYPELKTAVYNVRVRSNNNGKTFVNVNIVNPVFSGGTIPGTYSVIRSDSLQSKIYGDLPSRMWETAKSTGALEQYIIDMIK